MSQRCLSLPIIDRLIDGVSIFKNLFFMNAYLRYNRTKINSLDAPMIAIMINKVKVEVNQVAPDNNLMTSILNFFYGWEQVHIASES